MMSFTLVVLAAVALLQGADADCYNCTVVTVGDMSLGPAGCGEPFDSTGLHTIPCKNKCKAAGSVIAEEGNTPAMTVVIRTCHDPNTEGPCVDLDNLEVVPGSIVYQSCCTGNLCNGGA